jgi:hypothetical protein
MLYGAKVRISERTAKFATKKIPLLINEQRHSKSLCLTKNPFLVESSLLDVGWRSALRQHI